MHYVYILRCADNSLYIGETSHLGLQLAKRHDGRACTFTSLRRPVTLVYSEQHQSRDSARRRERQLKRWTRSKKEVPIAGNLVLLKQL